LLYRTIQEHWSTFLAERGRTIHAGMLWAALFLELL
jgi:hypothetical protein